MGLCCRLWNQRILSSLLLAWYLYGASPRVDDIKYSRGDGCSVFWVEVRVGLEKLQAWVVEEQFPDEWLQVVLHCIQHMKKRYLKTKNRQLLGEARRSSAGWNNAQQQRTKPSPVATCCGPVGGPKLHTAYCNECAYLPHGDRGNVTLRRNNLHVSA